MEVITYKCPNCGGDLTFDPASGKYKCEYCLSSFTQEEAEKANPNAAEALNGEDDAAGAQEASDAQKESSTEETKGETEQGEAVVYTCPNCGAEIVTDATTAATYCFYCHNPVAFRPAFGRIYAGFCAAVQNQQGAGNREIFVIYPEETLYSEGLFRKESGTEDDRCLFPVLDLRRRH